MPSFLAEKFGETDCPLGPAAVLRKESFKEGRRDRTVKGETGAGTYCASVGSGVSLLCRHCRESP